MTYIRFLFLFTLISGASICCFGQSKTSAKPVTKTGTVVRASQPNIPPAAGWVNDWEHLFSAQQAHYLDSLISQFSRQTTMQIAIVTIDTGKVALANFDQYTLDIFNKWGVGVKGKNNGILIGISKGYRKMRIQNGFGTSLILSDAETKKIVDENFIPPFRDGKYFEGTRAGLLQLMAVLKSHLSQKNKNK